MIHLGSYKGKEVLMDLEKEINGHGLITGGTGTGKSNFLMYYLNQVKSDYVAILGYSGSFTGFEGTDRINASSSSILRNFFDGLSLRNASMFADSIQGTFRLGRSQKATLLKALFKMGTPLAKEEITPLEEESIYYRYLAYKGNVVVQDWAKLAFILDTKMGSKGAELATLFLELVVTLYDKEEVSDDREGVSVITFPLECIGASAIMVELYLWKIWFEQPDLHRETGREIVLVLDECQNLNWRKGSIAEKMLLEGRKFGISIILSTQFTSENFPKRVITSFMQSGTRVIFAPPEPEVKSIAQSLDSTSWKNWMKTLRNLKRGI